MTIKNFLRLGMATSVVACAVSLSSCNGNGELTKSDVENEVERVLTPVLDHYQTTTITTGYYELNSENARYELRKLASLGLGTYKAENIIETTNSYWYGKRKEDHIFVEVALTPEGQKYVLNEADLKKIEEATLKAAIDEDLENPNADKKWPEDGVEEYEEIPVIDDQAESEPSKSSSNKKTDAASSKKSDSSDSSALSDNSSKSAYERACAKVNEVEVTVKSYRIDIAKVRNIRCTPAMIEEGVAEAEVILELVDVTPFGRILNNKVEGRKDVKKVKFEKYTDGWKIVK